MREALDGRENAKTSFWIAVGWACARFSEGQVGFGFLAIFVWVVWAMIVIAISDRRRARESE
jgi:hypothetical protein